MSEIDNIKERLRKVSVLVDAGYTGAVSQLIKDCKFLITLIETEREFHKDHDESA